MLTSAATLALCWLSTFQSATAVAVGDVGVRTNDFDPQTAKEVGRALLEAREKEKVYTLNKTKIAKSWRDAELFSLDLSKYEYIDITCKHCYLKTEVGGHLKFSEDVNLTKIVDDFGDDMKNSTETAWHQIKEYVKDVAKDIWHFNIHDIPSWPTIDADFQLKNVSSDLPPMEARFEFDHLDLYVDMEVELEAETNYYLPLFISESPVGFAIPDMEVGAIIKASLMIISDTYVDIRSGFHLKLKDTLALDIELFTNKVSRIKLPESAFEMLPTSGNGEGSLEIILELSADIGFELYTYKFGGILSASTGIQASGYADLADIYLDFKAQPKHKKCPLAAHAEYTMAVGADAGATIDVEDYQWGPYGQTSTAFYSTILPTICAGSKTPTKTHSATTTGTSLTKSSKTTASPDARAAVQRDMVTTTVSTTKSFTMVNCVSPSMIRCPNSLQNTTSAEKTMSTVLTVPSGVTASFPPDTHASVTDTVPFSSGHATVPATTGVPKQTQDVNQAFRGRVNDALSYLDESFEGSS